MPSSSLSVEMTGEEARLFQSFQNVIRQSARFEESLDKSGRAAKGLAREERAMAREAKRAFEEARPPLERYNETKRKLEALLQKGKITQGEYNAAVRRSKQEMEAAGRSGERAFGARALGGLKSYVAGVASATAAIALVKGGLQAIIRIGEEAAAKARGSIQEFGGLRQVAEGGTFVEAERDFQRLVGKGRRVQAMGVEEGEAARIVFAGRSAGLAEEDIMLLGQMRARGFAEPEPIAQAVSGLRTALGPEVGDLRGIASMGLAAAAPVAGTTAQDILAASGKMGRAGAAIGLELPEMLSALGEIARTEGTDSGQTQLQALFRGLSRRSATGDIDLGGATTLVEMVQAVEAMELDEATLNTMFDQRGVRAFRAIAGGAADIQARARTIAAAPGENLLGMRLGLGERSLDAAIDAQAAEGARDVGRVGVGTQENRAQALRANMEQAMREAEYSEAAIMWSLGARGGSPFRIAQDFVDPAGRAERLAELVLDPPDAVRGTRGQRAALEAINRDRRAFGVDTPDENAALDKLLEAAGKIDRAADHLERAAQAGPALVAPGEDR